MKKAIFAIAMVSLFVATSLAVATPVTRDVPQSKGVIWPTVGAIKVETYIDFPDGTIKKINTHRSVDGGVVCGDYILVIIPSGKMQSTVTVTFDPAFPYINQPTKSETYTVGPGILGAILENDYKYHQVHWWW